MKIGSRGLPHLAKNERDMGHPLIRGRDRNWTGGFSPLGPPGTSEHRVRIFSRPYGTKYRVLMQTSRPNVVFHASATRLESCLDTKQDAVPEAVDGSAVSLEAYGCSESLRGPCPKRGT